MYVDLLWTAPELLRMPNKKQHTHHPILGTCEGDVYSFGIIVQELCYMDKPFGSLYRKLGAIGLHPALFYLKFHLIVSC